MGHRIRLLSSRAVWSGWRKSSLWYEAYWLEGSSSRLGIFICASVPYDILAILSIYIIIHSENISSKHDFIFKGSFGNINYSLLYAKCERAQRARPRIATPTDGPLFNFRFPPLVNLRTVRWVLRIFAKY